MSESAASDVLHIAPYVQSKAKSHRFEVWLRKKIPLQKR